MITIVAWKYYGLCTLAAVGGIVILCVAALLVIGAFAFDNPDKAKANVEHWDSTRG